VTLSEGDGTATCSVRRGTFVHDVTEKGSVESANNVEIRSEVENRGASGTMILWIIPEGAYVEPSPDWEPKEPGEEPPDLLVKLDSSSLEARRVEQQIVVNGSKAALTEARSLYENAIKEVELANTKLEVLEKYTRPKMLAQLESQVATAGARLKAQERMHQLDLDKLAKVEEQIEKCSIRAPQAGQAVYAHVTDRRGGREIIIEEGTLVRQRQTILRLSDSNKMQIKVKIDEARVSRVEAGMRATIRLNAFPDLEPMSGTVEKVNEYPLPSGWGSGDVREYETTIKIDGFPEDLDMRPGMTSEVTIRVEEIDDVLILPVQAVLEHGGKHYCAIPDGDAWKRREVTVGSTNDSEVVILKGLTEGEKVAYRAARYRDEFDLSKSTGSN